MTGFKKAERRAVRLKIAVDGPSGSGKTMGALALASGITHGGRIAVIDSENGSAALYADRFAFDAIAIDEHDPKNYRDLIKLAVSEGYDVLVIDSLTHAWQAVLNAKDDHDRTNPKSNGWTNWRLFAPRWEALMQDILQAPIHIVATMRSKQAYEQIENAGRKQIVKLGLQPQVRDGAEYEFGIVFSVNIAHHAEATKDRTGLFAGAMLNLCDEKLHATLRRWMNEGGPVVDTPKAPVEELKVGGRPMTEMDNGELERFITMRSGEGKYITRVTRAHEILAERRANKSDDEIVKRMVSEVEAETAELPFA